MNTTFSLPNELSQGWKLTRKHLLVFAGLSLIFLLIVIFAEILSQISFSADSPLPFGLFVIYFLFLVFFGVGFMAISLRTLDGGDPDFRSFITPPMIYVKVTGLYLMIGLTVTIGFMLFILPGIYLLLRVMYAPYLLIDKKLSVSDSIAQSWRITQGHLLELFGWLLLSTLIIIAGAILLLVGLLAAYPWVMLTNASIYRSLQTEYGAEPGNKNG